jgi:predicted DCC family thiol-disulfide oxidoreductase YuxK
MNHVVIFDGHCNLCAHSVKFILAHERGPTLHFASVQSPAGARLMQQLGFDPSDVKTFVLLADGQAYTKSDAAIRVARYFAGGWKLLGVFKFIPRPLRDWAYDFLAKHRYRWFGRMDSCLVPTAELRNRFLQE